MENCEKCKFEQRILEMEKDIQRNAEAHKEFYHRFEDIGGRQVGYEKDIAHLMQMLADISRDVKDLKEKPAKRWDTVVVCALTAVVSAAIGFMLNGIIPV